MYDIQINANSIWSYIEQIKFSHEMLFFLISVVTNDLMFVSTEYHI